MIICNVFHALAEKTIPFEKDAFLWLNAQHSVFFDLFMSIYTQKYIWIPFLIAFLYLIFTSKVKWAESLLVIISLIITITLCDQIASSLIKPLCERLRPTHYPGIENLVHIVNGYHGGKYGFISSHAANGFGFATFLTLLFRKRLLNFVVFFAATLTAYSRIYLGVHFISDIIGGILVGCFIGSLIYILYTKSRTYFLHIPPQESTICAFENANYKILIYTYIATILIILAASVILLF